jgi:3-oxoacyl-[acyl-carrier protein] reductase
VTEKIFKGEVAVVNAAAGSGIGAAIVHALLERGAAVMASDRSASRIARLHDDLASRYDANRFLTLIVEGSNEDAVSDSLRQTQACFGRIDKLVNNIGLNQLAPIATTSLESWHKVMDVSLTAHFLHIKHAWPYLTQSDAATIVNISSLAGERPTAFGEAAYAAAKAGTLGLTRAAAAEGAPHIRVNAVMPGLIWNENLSKAVAEDYIEAYRSRSPLGRAGTPQEVAEVVMFLSCAASAHVSGEVIRVAC